MYSDRSFSVSRGDAVVRSRVDGASVVSDRALSIAHVASVGRGRALCVADEAPVPRGRADGAPVVSCRTLNFAVGAPVPIGRRRSVGSVGAPLATGQAPEATRRWESVVRGGEA